MRRRGKNHPEMRSREKGHPEAFKGIQILIKLTDAIELHFFHLNCTESPICLNNLIEIKIIASLNEIGRPEKMS